MLSDVGADRVFPRPDRVGALDQHGGRRPPVEGEGASAALPRLLASAASEEVRSRHSPPPLQPPPPLSHHQQRPPWQSMDLAHQARVAARGGSSSSAVGGRSDGDGDRPSERPPLSLPSSASSPALDRVARVGMSSRYEDAGGGLRGRGHDHRDHRRLSRSSGSQPQSQSHSQWSSYPGAGPPLSGHESWMESSRSRDRGFSLSGAVGADVGGTPEHPFNQYHEGHRDRRHYHPSSAAAAAWPPHTQVPSSSSSAAAEAAIAMTRLSPPPPWDVAHGKPGGGDTRLRQPQPQQDYREGVHAGLGLPRERERERPWPVGGMTYSERPRGPYPDDGHLRGSPVSEFRHGPPQQHQDRLARLRSFFPPVPEAPPARASPLRMDREEDEAALYATATGMRPLVSAGISDADAERPPYGSLPGLAESVGTIGGEAMRSDGRFTFGESPAAAAAAAAATASAAAAAAAGGAYRDQGQQQRRRSASTGSATGTGRGCKEDGCDRRPIYAYKGSKKAAYCARHRLVGMIDTRHPLCKNEHCTRQPSFGMEGDRRASYCAEHKLPEMINVSSRRCQQTGCLRHPNFGFPGDRRASYCSGHRETGMVDIVSRRCREPSCGRRPLYNMDGLRPVCCSQHKSPGMIDVVSTRCQEPGCFCHPSFGYASDKKARRCARHRLENMEGVKGHRQKRRRE
ncbi:unnamed protein product, partial [Hapterophycus canaliculatus]